MSTPSQPRTITIPFNYSPRDYQLELLQAPQRFKIAVIHRRGGKSKTVFNEQVRKTQLPENKNKIFYYFLPTYRQAKSVIWDELVKMHVPPEIVDKFNGSELAIYYKNGAIQRFAGCEDIDKHRGINPIDVVFDEYSEMNPDIWTAIIQPVLRENRGTATFIFTPKGKNHSWELLQTAKQSPSEWYTTVKGVEDTGGLLESEIEAAKKETPEAMFRQEYLCDFLDNAGAFFRRIKENTYAADDTPHPAHYYQVGIDLAKYNDWTVITPFDLATFRVKKQERFNQVDWNFQKALIEANVRKYNNAKIKIDRTGCFVAGQNVLTEKGFKQIDAIENGEKVLTSNHSFQEIFNIHQMRRKIEVVSIFPQYQCFPINVSFNHAVLTEDGYKKAGDLVEGDLLKIPVFKAKKKINFAKIFGEFRKNLHHPKQDLFANESFWKESSFWRFVGYYVAEGYTRDDKYHKGIGFSFHMKETDYHKDVTDCIEKIFGRKPSIRREHGGVQVMEIYVSINKLALWFKSFGKAVNKKFPSWFDFLPDKFLIEVIKGYWRGDGDFSITKRKTSNSQKFAYRFHSASYDLIATVQRWLWRFQIISSITRSKRLPNDKFVLNIYGSEAVKFAKLIGEPEFKGVKVFHSTQGYFKDNGDLFVPIKKLSLSSGMTDLFEFTVRKQNDCYVGGGFVHNVGDPIVEDLERRGLNIGEDGAVVFTRQSRRELLDNLAILLQQDKIKIPNDPILIAELEAFQFILTDKGKIEVKTRRDMHDDCVFSLALAVHGVDVNVVNNFSDDSDRIHSDEEQDKNFDRFAII